MSDISITVIYHGMFLNVLYQYHQDEWYVYHSDLSWYVSECTVSVSPRWVIHLSQYASDCTVPVSLRWVIHISMWFIMVCFWMYCISITKMSDTYITDSDLSWYVSECTVSVSLRWVIHLSQWFIMVCFWMYCTSITKMSDTSVTVIYHGMSLTVLYQYH
jgi:hypothetical protein